MEFIMVNSQKLKIILTPKDMEEMEINIESLDYGSVKTRRALKSILEKAKNETGFDIKHDRVYVQVFQSVDGGCEMFLSRKGRLLPEQNEEITTYYKKKYGLYQDDSRAKHEYIAASESIDDIIKLCIRLKKEGFNGASELYFYNGTYYLLLFFARRFPSFVKDVMPFGEEERFSFICEYASVYFAESLPLAVLKERGKKIASERAVERISEKFDDT